MASEPAQSRRGGQAGGEGSEGGDMAKAHASLIGTPGTRWNVRNPGKSGESEPWGSSQVPQKVR